MKIITTISLITSLIIPSGIKDIAKPLIYIGTGNNSMIDLSYYYGVEYVDIPTTYDGSISNSVSANYYCDMIVNIRGEYSGSVRINYTAPNSSAPSDYKINYVLFGCNSVTTSVNNTYVNVYIPDGANEFTVRFYFNKLSITYYGMSQTVNDELTWINQANNGNTMYFGPTSISNNLTYLDEVVDYQIDYTDYLVDNDGNDMIYYLDQIQMNGQDVNAYLYNIYEVLINNLIAMKTALNNISTELTTIDNQLYNVDQDLYSYAIANQWLAGVVSSQSHIYDMSYEYFNNSNGPAHPNTMSTYWFSTYNINGIYTPNGYNSQFSNWFNTKIIIFLKNIGGSDMAYWVNFPLTAYTYDSFTNDYQDYLYFSDPKNNDLYCLKIHHKWNRLEESRPLVYFDMYKLTIGSDNITLVNFNDYCGGVYLTNQPISTNNILKHGFNDLIEAINNISVSVNVSNTQITNEVNEYNTNINNVYTIENNINTQLQNTLQGYTLPDNTNLLESLSHTTTMFSSVLTRLNGVSIITVPLSIALVGIILIAILG